MRGATTSASATLPQLLVIIFPLPTTDPDASLGADIQQGLPRLKTYSSWNCAPPLTFISSMNASTLASSSSEGSGRWITPIGTTWTGASEPRANTDVVGRSDDAASFWSPSTLGRLSMLRRLSRGVLPLWAEAWRGCPCAGVVAWTSSSGIQEPMAFQAGRVEAQRDVEGRETREYMQGQRSSTPRSVGRPMTKLGV